MEGKLGRVFCEHSVLHYSDWQLSSSRTAGLREDGKLSLRESAAGDPQGLRDQVRNLLSLK